MADRKGAERREDSASKEADILDRTGVIIPAEDWDAFEAWIERPAEAIPALAELARRARMARMADVQLAFGNEAEPARFPVPVPDVDP